MRKFKENVDLRDYSNYRIGGPAKFFFEAKNAEEVVWAIGEAKKSGAEIFILGGGTNLLIGDEGIAGLVLMPKIGSLEARGEKIFAGAGVLMPDLLDFAAERGLGGLEWAGGLPGTLGGAIRGNAGCFGGEIKDAVESVQSFDVGKMQIVERSASECAFSYRDSVFKKKNGAEVVLSAIMRLKKSDKKEIKKAIEEKIAHRQKNHPLEHPNIGSIFKNVPLERVCDKGSKKHAEALKNSVLEFKGSRFSVKTDPFPVISAAKLVSEAGLRGITCGGAMISAKHPNFIVNVLEAKSSDVASLMELAKSEVRKKFGVELEEEVLVV